MLAKLTTHIAILMFISFPVMADEWREREQVRNSTVEMFYDENYTQIESTSRQYRESEERFESGIWKLSEYYKGFADYARDPYLWDSTIAKLNNQTNELVNRYPSSPGAVVFRAEFLYSSAWRIRGGGPARNVAPEIWPVFYERIQETIDFLEDNHEVGRADPEWYNLLAGAYWTKGDRNTAHALLWQGLEDFPGYYNLYFTAGLYQSPQWGGDGALIELFANRAVDHSRETEGTGMYVRIYWSAATVRQLREYFFSAPFMNWNKMKESMYDVLDRYPSDWNAQNFAFFACLKDDSELAKDMLDRMEEGPIDSVWSREISFENCLDIANR